MAQGNACQCVSIEGIQKCAECKEFHESAKLHCGHKVQIEEEITTNSTIVEVNALDSTMGELQLDPGFVNSRPASILRNTGSTLVGVRKE